MAAPGSPDDVSENEVRFRWQALFQQAAEPLFLLNRRRRVLFVNRAWETLTGLALADVKGQVCRRRPRGIVAEKVESVLGALAPPAETFQGQTGQARRLVALGAAPAWWQIAYFPVGSGDALLGILGKITVVGNLALGTGPPLSEKMQAVRQRHWEHFRIDDLASDVPAMVRLREQVRLAAQTRLPVSLVGPPGTGKQWLARAIHHLGPDREKPFACLDCARLPPNVLVDLMLGTGLPPHLATVYLHQADRLPRDLQERLQQRLETEVGPRVLAGFEHDPYKAVRAQQVLNELYCRLSPLVLMVPPLKERMDDFTAWVERLLLRANRAAERTVRGVSPEAALILRAHAWPGNLHELYSVLFEACLRARGDQLDPADLPFYLRHVPLPEVKPLVLDAILEQVERRLIAQALQLARNNKSRAAELLTIWRARLLRRMETLGITDNRPDNE